MVKSFESIAIANGRCWGSLTPDVNCSVLVLLRIHLILLDTGLMMIARIGSTQNCLFFQRTEMFYVWMITIILLCMLLHLIQVLMNVLRRDPTHRFLAAQPLQNQRGFILLVTNTPSPARTPPVKIALDAFVVKQQGQALRSKSLQGQALPST